MFFFFVENQMFFSKVINILFRNPTIMFCLMFHVRCSMDNYKCIKHLNGLWLVLFTLRGRESPSTSERRSWWRTYGASWRPEEKETSSASTGSPCLLIIGFPRLSSTLECCDTLMRCCGPWRMVSSLSGQAKTPFRKIVNDSWLHVECLAGELLSSGDRREVEIRGCSIWAVELIKDRFCKLVQERDMQTFSINSAIIDFYLWPYAKQHHKEMAHIPIHHTRCVYYWQTGWQCYIQVQFWH